MRTRRLGFGCVLACACAVSSAWASDEPSPQTGTCDAAAVLVDDAAGVLEAVPLAPGVPVHRVSIVGDAIIDEGTVSGTEPDCHETDGAVYCNTLGTRVFGPETANVKFADDIALAAVGGCRLDHYVIRVTGDRNQDGVAAGEYKVNVAMYNTCPGAGGTTAITGTIKQFTVPAANAAEISEISYAPLAIVALPSNLYFGVSFSRSDCGIVVGSPALLGYSADRFDHPSFACSSGLGGYPGAPHASFYVEIYVTGTCDAAFAGYKNVNDAGTGYSAGTRVFFADDISLDVPQCNMIAYEVNHKGSGYFKAQLHTFLNNDSPGSGGLIPNTPSDCFSSGPNPQICRKAFDPPILLTSANIWVVFRSGASAVGPVQTCQRADPGQTGDLYMVHRDGAWTAESFTGCYSGFGVTIFCDGQPPIGACCDMNQTDAQGESVCRNALPEMNCPFPELWKQNEVCDSVCEGGSNNGMPCMRQADCPGGECPGPFPEPCGYAACCKPSGACENLTQNVCNALPPPEDPRLFQKGQFCSVGDQQCPFPACLARDGECTLPRPAYCVGGYDDGDLCNPFAPQPGDCHGMCVGGDNPGNPCWYTSQCPGGTCPRALCVGEVGCDDMWCCTDVCTDAHNYFCCTTWWDEQCAAEAYRLCDKAPSNDECYFDLAPLKGARLVDIPSDVESDGINAKTGAVDPGFCCHGDTPGADGVKTVWFKFLAPPNGVCAGGTRNGAFCDPNAEDPNNTLDGCPGGVCNALPTSVSIDTCCSNIRLGHPADDSLLQVFTTADPDRGVCSDGLTQCSLDVQDCVDGRPCVHDGRWACQNLVPVACSDDAGTSCVCGQVQKPNNSRLCVTGLNPGQMYYVLVGAKSDDHDGVWKLRFASPCSNPRPPLPNDLCFNATPLSGEHVEVPFNLSGGTTNSPCTFDCPGPPSAVEGCMDTMQNDVWYDWTAPCDGLVTIETCGGSDELTPDTGLAVYDGCECPVDFYPLACSDFQASPCFLGSKVMDVEVAEGGCYKIRLGGSLGGTPAGPLKINVTECWECADDTNCDDGLYCNGAEWCFNHGCLMGMAPCEGTGQLCNEITDTCVDCLVDGDCPPGWTCVGGVCVRGCPNGLVTFVSPPTGTVDARQPYPPGDATNLQNIKTFTVDGPAGAADNGVACWSLCESVVQGAPNAIASVVDTGPGAGGSRRYTVTLQRPMSFGAVTTITYTDDLAVAHRGVFTSHPANVNGDSASAPADILRVIDCLNGVAVCLNPWQQDIDRSLVFGPPDILRVIDLLNGAGAYDPWLNSRKPVCDATNCCP